MGGKRIFIVENERIVALDLQHRLTSIGYKIVGNVVSGGEALKQISEVKPDLVLTDIRLGGDVDGFDLADAVHRQYGVAVIFITAYSDEKTIARVKATSACGFIIKPFTNEELQATIDISMHEHELEVMLKQSEEQYRCLFDEAPVGYHEIDLKGCLTRVNRTELKMLDYEEADVIGRPVWDFVRDKDLSREAVIKKIETKQISSNPFERNYLQRGGKTVPVLVKDYPIRSAKGELRGIRSTIQDISLLKDEQAKRQRLEAGLRQAEKLESIGVMAGGLAHELNNQLMAIQGNVSLALINLPAEAQEARGYLQSVLAACQRSASVIKQLLVAAGKVKGEFKPVNLSKIILDMLPSLKKDVGKDIELLPKLADDLPPVSGDADQLKQLLALLVRNAGEAIKNNKKIGIVQIETGLDEPAKNHNSDYDILLRNKPFTQGRRCYLSVIDNSQGMDEKTRSRLFDPFFTTKGVGRGLGLSAALGIIKNHAGDIFVKSTLGSGTKVRIVFDCVIASKKIN